MWVKLHIWWSEISVHYTACVLHSRLLICFSDVLRTPASRIMSHAPPDTSTSLRRYVARANTTKKHKKISTVIINIFFTHPNWHIHNLFLLNTHDKNAPKYKLHGIISLGEYTQPQSWKLFQQLLKFSNTSHCFQTLGGLVFIQVPRKKLNLVF